MQVRLEALRGELETGQAAEDRFEVGEGQHPDSLVEGAARRVADERGNGRPDAGDRAHAAGYLLDVDAGVRGCRGPQPLSFLALGPARCRQSGAGKPSPDYS